MNNNILDQIFCIEKQSKTVDNFIIFENEKMSNEEFRQTTEEIRACDSIMDKIDIIRSITNIMDLIDLFEADCIYQNEFLQIYSSLNENELSLLFKADSIKRKRDEIKLWQEKFLQFYTEMDCKQKDRIAINANQLPHLDI